MNYLPMVFDTEIQDHVLIVSPRLDADSPTEDEAEKRRLLGQIEHARVKHVVFDFEKIELLDSALLQVMARIWKRIRAGGGQMAVYNVSDLDVEILRVTKLDTIWPICDSRQEALDEVKKSQ